MLDESKQKLNKVQEHVNHNQTLEKLVFPPLNLILFSYVKMVTVMVSWFHFLPLPESIVRVTLSNSHLLPQDFSLC